MPSYAASRVVVNPTQVASQLSGGTAANTVAALFTAPQGPDVPTLFSPAQGAQLYGAPSSSASSGYSGPLGINILGSQSQTARSSPINLLGMRVGVVRASITAGGLTLQGVGQYAGSKGNNLAVQYTVAAGAITSITVVDTSNANAPVAGFPITNAQANLTSWQNIANAINGSQPSANPASNVYVSAVNTAIAYPGLAIAAPGTSFTGGADGAGATATDATIATLLNQSLAYHASYLWAGFDAAAIAPGLLAHFTAAQAANEFRYATLGPAAGTTYTSLSGAYTTPFLADTLQCVGHDLAYLGAGSQTPSGNGGIVDGFYLAAAVCALKATGRRRVTCNKREPLAGFTGFGNTGLGGAPTPPQADALGQVGNTVLRQGANGGPITIRDNITTTPEYPAGSSQINIFYQASMRDVDNAVKFDLYQAVDPFSGQARLDSASDVADISYAINTAVAQMGDTVNGFGPNNVQLSINPTTGNPQAAVNLLYPFPYGEIDITPVVSI